MMFGREEKVKSVRGRIDGLIYRQERGFRSIPRRLVAIWVDLGRRRG